MRRFIGVFYLSLLCGAFAYFFASFKGWSSQVTGMAVAGAAIVSFLLGSLKSVFETRKLFYEGSIKKEELDRMRSRIYLPSREDVDKHGQTYAIVDREAKRWLERRQLRVEPRKFIERASESGDPTS